MAATRTKRTALSFVVDDTVPPPLGGLGQFFDFCAIHGVRGKISFIPAYGGRANGLSGHGKFWPEDEAFLAALRRSRDFGFDVHMELMTHDKLWDFAAGRHAEGAPCEGIWLQDMSRSREEYRTYFAAILETAARQGVKLDGLTRPGCDCEQCLPAYAALAAEGPMRLNPAVMEALLDLAEEGRFATPALTIFSEPADPDHPAAVLARRGRHAVVDLRPNTVDPDRFGYDGIADPDHYITADGQSGEVVDLVRGGADHCLMVAHWFAMFPGKSEGWAAFQAVVRRINRHLAGQIEWTSPSAFAARLAGLADQRRADVSQG